MGHPENKRKVGNFFILFNKRWSTLVCVRVWRGGGRGRGQGGQTFLDIMSFFISNEPIFQFFVQLSTPLLETTPSSPGFPSGPCHCHTSR